MKNYEEFKGYKYRVEYDTVSKSFVYRKLDDTDTIVDQNDESAAIAPPTFLKAFKVATRTTGHSCEKRVDNQSFVSPKPIRSKTLMSMSKILPR
jgi:hypothetical protein